MLRQAASLVSLFLFAGCSAPIADAQNQAACSIYETRDWNASLKPADGKGDYLLSISGVVDLPDPSYDVARGGGPLDRRQPPALILNLNAYSSGGVGIQVIDARTVAFEHPTPIPAFREVRVVCADRTLVVFENVGLP